MKKRIIDKFPSTALLALVLALGCSFSDTTVDQTPVDRIVLFDQDGKQWDVTQSVFLYGFEKSQYSFGLGAFATQPLILPPMIGSSEAGYPPIDSVFTVVGTVLGNDPRAYGLRELFSFEVVNDIQSGTPLAIVYEPILETTAAFNRVTGGNTLTLSASGWAYGSQTVLFDYETESMWYALDGTSGLTCINGTYLGSVLEEIPSNQHSWVDWRNMHPNTRVLRLPTP